MNPARLGRYEILAELGRGAMGRVYRARDPIVDREVALKTIQIGEFPKRQQEEILGRFRREAQAAGQLNHPNIVTIFDVGDSFFVMEMVKGETLQAYIARKGRLDLDETLGILSPIAAALDYAHRRGVVHRDVKPANIMLTDRGIPKLMDFGLAHTEATVLTRAGQSLGSPAYMSPEQIQGFDPTSRADLYSLSVVAYEMLTGMRPFAGKNITTLLHQVVHDTPPPPRRYNAALPPRYDDLFQKALSKLPEERFATGGSFITELNLKELEEIVSLIDALEPAKETAAPPAEDAQELQTVIAHEPQKRVPSASTTERRPNLRVRAEGRSLWLAASAFGAGALLVGLVIVRSLAPSGAPSIALQIESSPSGAKVWLDGAEVGTTPLAIDGAVAGPHQLTVSKEGFVPARESLNLYAESPPSPFVFALQPAAASVSISSNPASATVSVDGKEIGKTPIDDLNLEPGTHRVEVRVGGFQAWRTEVEARSGESLQIVATLERAAARPKPELPRPAAAAVASPPIEPAPEPAPAVAELGDPNVSQPRKISGEFARYPEPARKRGVDGAVMVSMVISETGIPEELRVEQSGGPLLDEAVLKAVETWRFEPATKSGQPVRIRWKVRQTFRLESRD
jgi:serine/threonine-protein kinase